MEIAHEALPRAWPRLREWIDTNRAGLLIQQRLAEAANAWDHEGRHPAGLYQGPRLAAARDWADTADPDLTPLVGVFLAAAIQRERDEQRATRLRTRRLRQFVAVLGVMLLLTAATTVLAVRARNDAVKGREESISRKVASDTIGLRATDHGLAAQLSLAAFRLAGTAEARGALISSLVTPDPTRLSSGDSANAVRAAAFSPKGDVLASGGQDNTAHLWRVTDSLNLRELAVLRGHGDAVRSVAFSPDGHTLATASSDRKAKLWDVTDPSHPHDLATLTGHQMGVLGVVFSPDGHVLATASADRTVMLWDVTDPSHPHELATLSRHAGFVVSVAFSPHGHVLATANSDTTAKLWDITDLSHPRELATLTGHTAPVYGLAFSPDGHTLATASVDTTVRLWNVTDPGHPVVLAAPLVGHTDNVYSVPFSPDGHTLATASHDTTVRLWEIDPDRIAARICALRRPAITRAEWDHYFPGVTYRPPCPVPGPPR
ncbi:MAG: WD40 repeat domain-containing protein [Pseudonocardiaceae bacterium]